MSFRAPRIWSCGRRAPRRSAIRRGSPSIALERTKDFAAAERLGLEFAEDFLLLQDIGWSENDVREMVRRLLVGGEGLAMVVGEAGSGKTYATLAAAEGWADAGIELRVAAPT